MLHLSVCKYVIMYTYTSLLLTMLKTHFKCYSHLLYFKFNHNNFYIFTIYIMKVRRLWVELELKLQYSKRQDKKNAKSNSSKKKNKKKT